jgi:digeranylgeranylglycerophospholipid reductase
MLENTVKDGFILAGDAAGLPNPVTGAGIYNAVLSANIAFNRIREAVRKKDNSLLKSIQEEYCSNFGISLARAAARREEMLSRWSIGIRSVDDFEELIKDCWVSFKQYWRN